VELHTVSTRPVDSFSARLVAAAAERAFDIVFTSQTTYLLQVCLVLRSFVLYDTPLIMWRNDPSIVATAAACCSHLFNSLKSRHHGIDMQLFCPLSIPCLKPAALRRRSCRTLRASLRVCSMRCQHTRMHRPSRGHSSLWTAITASAPSRRTCRLWPPNAAMSGATPFPQGISERQNARRTVH